MFLVSCTFFNKCLYFSYYIAGYLLDRPHIQNKCKILKCGKKKADHREPWYPKKDMMVRFLDFISASHISDLKPKKTATQDGKGVGDG